MQSVLLPLPPFWVTKVIAFIANPPLTGSHDAMLTEA
jgi:hypothetical protein